MIESSFLQGLKHSAGRGQENPVIAAAMGLVLDSGDEKTEAYVRGYPYCCGGDWQVPARYADFQGRRPW